MNKFFLTIFLTIGISVFGNIEVDSFFSNNMVLPHSVENRIWGKSEPNQNLKIVFNNKNINIKSDATGYWEGLLPPIKPNEIATIKILQNENSIEIQNIIGGDIWFCFGQDNMNFPLKKSKNYPFAVRNANKYTNLRVITLNKKTNSTPQKFSATEGWELSEQKNIADFSAVAFYFGMQVSDNTDMPIGLINASTDNNKIQSWLNQSDAEKDENIKSLLDDEVKLQTDKTLESHKNFTLFNQMVAPLKNLSIAGFIWYQGESNIQKSNTYIEYFPFMVNSFRNFFNAKNAPFLYVQLPPHDYIFHNKKAVTFRAMQENCLNLIPNSAMVGTIDAGEKTKNIPRNKKIIGDRLAYAALNLKYKEDFPYTNPTIEKVQEIASGKFVVYCKNAKLGMDVKTCIKGFVFKNKSDTIFAYPDFIYTEGDKIILQNINVVEPYFLEFALAPTNPIKIYNSENLPLLPCKIKIDRIFLK